MNKNQRGFTLIELVVVIIILGVLAAIAAPRFANLQGSARGAALNGLRASVMSAATMANALQVATSGSTSSSGVTMDGVGITMVRGYPDSNAGGIASAVSADATFASTPGATATFTITNASSQATCQFTYAASVGGVFPVVSTATTTGC